MFKIMELPDEIQEKLQAQAKKSEEKNMLQYSENMIVYTGRKGLHIFDIDREQWVFNSNRIGYKYQNHYYDAKGIEDTSEEYKSDDDEQNDGDDDEFFDAIEQMLENGEVMPAASSEDEEEEKEEECKESEALSPEFL